MDSKKIIVVTGLQRSGTSLVMQMLDAGGVDIVTDGSRPADGYNPKGYFEYAPIIRGADVSDAIQSLLGKAIKVYIAHLDRLPKDQEYKVILVERNPKAVVVSRINKNREGKPFAGDKFNIPTMKVTKLDRMVKKTKKWISQQENMSYITLDYDALIDTTDTEIQSLVSWLERDVDVDSMKNAIDPKLRHFKDDDNTINTSRAPVEIAELIQRYTADKVFCEIGIGEGDNLNAIKNAKDVVGIDISPYSVLRAKELYPHLHVIHGNILDKVSELNFDVCYMWLIYPLCRTVVSAVLQHHPEATILMGLNYYYHTPAPHPNYDRYVKAYAKKSNAETWNENIDDHLTQLRKEGYSVDLKQVMGTSGEVFNVAVINA